MYCALRDAKESSAESRINRREDIGEEFKWFVCRLSGRVAKRANITERPVCADPARIVD